MTTPLKASPEGSHDTKASHVKPSTSKRRKLLIAPCLKDPQHTPPIQLLESGNYSKIGTQTAHDTLQVAAASNKSVSAAQASRATIDERLRLHAAKNDSNSSHLPALPSSLAGARSSHHNLSLCDPATPAPAARVAHAAAHGRVAESNHETAFTGSVTPALTIAVTTLTAQQPVQQAAISSPPSARGRTVRTAQAASQALKTYSPASSPALSCHATSKFHNTKCNSTVKALGACGNVSLQHCRAQVADRDAKFVKVIGSTAKPSNMDDTGFNSIELQATDAAPVKADANTPMLSNLGKTGVSSHSSGRQLLMGNEPMPSDADLSMFKPGSMCKTNGSGQQPQEGKLSLVQRLPAVLTASLPSAESLGMDTNLPSAAAMLG